MHRIYHTLGFVLGSRPFGEAGKYFFVFTKELGMVKASAQGVRLLKSKLRYMLRELSYSDFSLVRGRDHWRITAVMEKDNLFNRFRNDPESVGVFIRAFSLLRRLVRGEDKNSQLFSEIERTYELLKHGSRTTEFIHNCECILVLRILYSLGYLGKSPDTDIFAESPFVDELLVLGLSKVKQRVLVQINKSLHASQL